MDEARSNREIYKTVRQLMRVYKDIVFSS